MIAKRSQFEYVCSLRENKRHLDDFTGNRTDVRAVPAQNPSVWPTHESLNREVNVVVMTPAEFASGVRAGQGFVSRVMAEPKLFVMGTSDDLEKLVGDSPAA
jgi:hypothetical protein